MLAAGVLNVLVNGPNGPVMPACWRTEVGEVKFEDVQHILVHRPFEPEAEAAGVDAVAELADPSGAELNGIARIEPRSIELDSPADVELKILVRRREPEAVVDEPPPEPPGRLDAAGVPFVEGDEIAAAVGGRHARDTPRTLAPTPPMPGGSGRSAGHELATTKGGPRHRLGEEDVGAGAGAGEPDRSAGP